MRTAERFRSRSKMRAARLAEMNVTNLVDVTMVTMIAFIIVAPMIKRGVDVDLPQADTPAAEVTDKHVVKVVQREDPASKERLIQLYLDENRYDLPTLEEKLSAIAEAEEDPVIYLEADKDLAYGEVMDVMSAIKRAKIVKVGLVTKKGGASERPKRASARPG